MQNLLLILLRNLQVSNDSENEMDSKEESKSEMIVHQEDERQECQRREKVSKKVNLK